MTYPKLLLHEGGHGHAGCCGEHSHEHAHEHVSGHHHEHGDTPELTPEQTLALMSYMLEHNRSHAGGTRRRRSSITPPTCS